MKGILQWPWNTIMILLLHDSGKYWMCIMCHKNIYSHNDYIKMDWHKLCFNMFKISFHKIGFCLLFAIPNGIPLGIATVASVIVITAHFHLSRSTQAWSLLSVWYRVVHVALGPKELIWETHQQFLSTVNTHSFMSWGRYTPISNNAGLFFFPFPHSRNNEITTLFQSFDFSSVFPVLGKRAPSTFHSKSSQILFEFLANDMLDNIFHV